MAKMITLSARMQALADMVTRGNRVCDLGCDHGYLSIYLIQRQIAPHVLAMDVRKGPLERAGEHIGRARLEEYITLRLSDGLDGYRAGEAQSLVCAGMGGPLINRILEREPLKTKQFQELILQPQSELASFRRRLRESGWRIACEDMVLEDGKFYPVMKAYPAEYAPEERENSDGISEGAGDLFGPVLLRSCHPVLWEYLKREWKNCRELWETLEKAPDSERVRIRKGELSGEMEYLKEAARLYGNDYD